MPTSGEEPCSTACPWTAAASTAGSQSAPPSTRTVPRHRVGDHGVHRGGAHDDDVVEALRGERAGVVAGALRGDPQAGLRGDADHRADLGGGAGYGDRGRALVDGDVPGQSRGVVPGVAGQVDATGRQAAEGGGGPVGPERVGRGGRRGQVDGHGVTPCDVLACRVLGGTTVRRATWDRLRDDLERWSGPAWPDRVVRPGAAIPGWEAGESGGVRRPGSLCCGRGGRSPRPGRGEAGRAHGRPRHAQAAGAGRRAGPLRRPPGLGGHDRRPALGRRGAAGGEHHAAGLRLGPAPGDRARPGTPRPGHRAGHRRPGLRAAGRPTTPWTRRASRPTVRARAARAADRWRRSAGRPWAATCSPRPSRAWTRRSRSGAGRRTSSWRTRRRRWRSGPGWRSCRLVALEDRMLADLALGDHGTVAAELEALTAAHPLRERLCGGCGRSRWPAPGARPTRWTSCARCARCSTDELGLEPGAELRDLQTAVLRQDPALDWVAPAAGPPAPRPGPPRARPADGDPPVEPVGRLAAGRPRPGPRGAGRRPRHRGGGRGGVRRADRRAGHRQVPAERRAGGGGPGPRRSACWSGGARRTTARRRCGRGSRCSNGSAPASPAASRTEADEGGASSAPGSAIVRTVRDAARERPRLVILDDLHWADVASLRVLRLLAETADRRAGCWSSPPGARTPSRPARWPRWPRRWPGSTPYGWS